MFFIGCSTSSKTADKLFVSLQKQNILDKDLKLIAINYNTTTFERVDYDYSVTIYDNVDIDENIQYIEDVSTLGNFFSYKGGTYTEENKYIFSNEKKYNVDEKEFLFSKNYTFELAS